MRVHIIHKCYLNKDNLSRGLAESDPGKVINSFYMYFTEYIPDVRITDQVIRFAYEAEVMKIMKARVYVGIWKVCAVSAF